MLISVIKTYNLQGKYNVEKLGLKERVVCLLENDDPKVANDFGLVDFGPY